MIPLRAEDVVLVDGFDIRSVGKGVSRAAVNIGAGLCTRSTAEVAYVVVTTREGKEVLDESGAATIVLVPDMLSTVWEQIGLPLTAKRLRASLVYALRETAPVLSRNHVLHLTENSQSRWIRDPPSRARERARRSYQTLIEERSIRRARALLAISRSTAVELESRFRLPRESIAVVPLGVDERFFGAQPRAGNYIFHLGSDDPRDNTEAVVEAYVHLAGSHHPLPDLFIAGDIGSLAESVERKLADSSVRGSVKVLGRVTNSELASLYAGALLCLQPSSEEGFGLQPLEAMAAGTATIVVDTPAVRESVGLAAVMVPSAAITELASAMQRLIFDDAYRMDLGISGRRVAEGFGWNRTVDAVETTLRAQLPVKK